MVNKLAKKLLKIILIITRLALITICLHLVKQMQTSIEILSTLKYLFLKAKTNTSLVFVCIVTLQSSRHVLGLPSSLYPPFFMRETENIVFTCITELLRHCLFCTWYGKLSGQFEFRVFKHFFYFISHQKRVIPNRNLKRNGMKNDLHSLSLKSVSKLFSCSFKANI